MHIKLYDYQEENVRRLVDGRRMLLCDEPGLGKTLQILTTIDRLKSRKTLIVAPKIATGVFQYECKKWYNWNSIVYAGTPKQRAKLRDDFNSGACNILITNYALLDEVKMYYPQWTTIICDEVHLGGLLNKKTQKFKTLKSMICENLFLMTATPIRSNPADMWALLHLLYPKVYNSYWSWVHRYCTVVDTMFGKEIQPRPKNPIKFKEMLSKHMVRNLKKDVLTQLPSKTRQVLPMTMTAKQQKAYNDVLHDMILETDDDIIITTGVLAQLLRLRQILCCPKMIGIDDNGAAITALVEHYLPIEFDNKNSVVIATPFRQAVPYIVDAIKTSFPDIIVEEIHGGIKETAQEVAARFQSIPTHKKVIVYTIKSGASWTATDANVGYFLGCEWTCIDNEQAEDRIHRIGQSKPVRVNYILHDGTVDKLVMDKLDSKAYASNWSLKPEELIKEAKFNFSSTK